MILLLGLIAPSLAATRLVDASGGGAYATIQGAIDASSSGDHIEVARGTYTECINLSGLSLTITGAGSAHSTIDCGGLSAAAISASSGEALALAGFTILNGAESGVVAVNATLSLSDLLLSNLGHSSLDGAAIHATGGLLQLSQSTIQGSTAARGAIFLSEGASLELESSAFVDNQATHGPAIYTLYDADHPAITMEISDSSFRDNRADSHGGVIYADAYTAINSWGNSFVGNIGEYTHGGVFYLAMHGDLSSEGDTFEGNEARFARRGTDGGVAFLGSSTRASFVDSTFSSNGARSGGALYAQSEVDLNIQGAEFLHSRAHGDGGAIYAEADAAIGVHSTSFQGSRASESGGAIYAAGALSLQIEGSTFLNNEALSGSGGDISQLAGGALEIDRSSFEGSSAYRDGGSLALASLSAAARLSALSFVDTQAFVGYGGAIAASDQTDMELSDSTFSRTTSYLSGGAIYSIDNGNLDILESSFEDGQSQYSSAYGGAIYFNPSSSAGSGVGALSVSDSTFAGNRSNASGGAVHAEGATQVLLEDNLWMNNYARGHGAALYLSTYLLTAQVSRNHFCNNIDSIEGSTVFSSSGGSSTVESWRNNIFQENLAYESGGTFIAYPGSNSEFVNNTLVGNVAKGEDFFELPGAAVLLNSNFTHFANNIIAHTEEGTGVYSHDTSGAGSFNYNNWSANAGGDLGGSLSFSTSADGNHTADPGFRSYNMDGDCLNDDLRLAPGSANIDAGRPDILDPDGTISDIGAYGGPHSSGFDLDLDGFDSRDDCDDSNISIHPGALETWYDGIDADCSGGSDLDADGDGHEHTDFGGDDCEDEDGAISPSAEEVEDGVDNNCDGRVDEDAAGDSGVDSGNADTGNTDGGSTDSGSTDSGGTDGSGTDSGGTDGSGTDSGSTDSGGPSDGDHDGGEGSGVDTDPDGSPDAEDKVNSGCSTSDTSRAFPAGLGLLALLSGRLRRRSRASPFAQATEVG